jgi:alpha-1,3-glucosyltransferase
MIVLLLGVLYRISTGIGHYSGQNNGPDFGDYEAQRHWLEITTNIPPKDWYFSLY